MIKIFQIYYNEITGEKLEKEYTPYYNQEKNPYFENAVIRKLVEQGEHRGADYFGVVGPHLRIKLLAIKELLVAGGLAKGSMDDFSPPAFENLANRLDVDALGLSWIPPHNMFLLAEKHHPGFIQVIERVLEKLKFPYRLKEIQKLAIYYNFFVARPPVYERYVREMLVPAMELMENDPQIKALVNRDSHYPPHKQWPREKLLEIYHRPHPTFHTFILERLFSLWFQQQDYTYPGQPYF